MTLAFLNFIHPAILWGSALIAVPILIHILNKRRFRIVDWAAMDLLRKVERTNRRRLQLEDLLILLLRCLAVLLLTLLIARMILTGSAGLARVAGARTDRIVILDDSPSMEVRQGNRLTFSRSTAALADYVRKLARSRPGDTLTVLLTSAPDQPFLNGQVLGGDRAEVAASSIEGLSISALPARFDQTFLTLMRTLESEPSAKRALYVVSDFRRHDWIPAGREGGVPKQLGAVSEKIPDLTLVDVGQTVPSDLAITDVRAEERTIAAGVPSPFLVTVVNRGARDAEGASVAVSADGVPAGRVSVPPMAPGEAQTVSVPAVFAGAGPVVLEAELTEPDALSMDNRRAFAGTALPAARAVIVDGESDQEGEASQSFYLQRALAPPGERASGVGAEVISESAFDARNLENAQILFLCNVYGLTDERWRAIAEWTRNGGGVVVFCGDQIDGAAWNETLRNVAPGFLPVRFEEVAGDPTEKEWQALRLSRPDHPVLQAFAGDRNPFLQRVKIYRYWQLEAAASATVLATFDNGRAAIVDSTFGTGRVLVFATAADAQWGNWPSDPSYVVTLQQVVRYASRVGAASRVVAVGQPLRHEVSSSLYRGEARLFAPQAQEAEILRAAASSNSAAVVFESAALRQPGTWSLELTSHEGNAMRFPFAANIEASESDLEGMERGELLRRAGNASIRFVQGPEIPEADDASGGQTELTRLLVVLLIVALMLEQSLAWWFGRRRRVA